MHLTGSWAKREYRVRDYQEPIEPDLVLGSEAENGVELVQDCIKTRRT